MEGWMLSTGSGSKLHKQLIQQAEHGVCVCPSQGQEYGTELSPSPIRLSMGYVSVHPKDKSAEQS